MSSEERAKLEAWVWRKSGFATCSRCGVRFVELQACSVWCPRCAELELERDRDRLERARLERVERRPA